MVNHAQSLYEYAKDPDIGPNAGLVYYHTCNEVPVPLLNEGGIRHTNIMTREQWLAAAKKDQV